MVYTGSIIIYQYGMFFRRENIVIYFARNLSIVVGIVLVWRGIWELLNLVDRTFFAGNSFYSALIGIAVGLAVLYFPDKDLKELEKL